MPIAQPSGCRNCLARFTCIVRCCAGWTSGRCRRDDLVIGSCQAIADRYRGDGGTDVAVSYYGCDVHAIDPLTSGAAFREEFGLARDTPTVGMVAHMYPTRLRAFRETGVKGHEVFLDAAPLILERVPDARLFVVGEELVGNGTYRRTPGGQGRRPGVSRSVHFIGHRSDIASVLAGLDVVVNPSIEESASYAMVEALLMGKGVVASDVGGLPDTVQDGKTGLLVPPADPAALAGAVTELLADPFRRHEMGRRGRDRCLRQFDINATVASVQAIYLWHCTARNPRVTARGGAADDARHTLADRKGTARPARPRRTRRRHSPPDAAALSPRHASAGGGSGSVPTAWS